MLLELPSVIMLVGVGWTVRRTLLRQVNERNQILTASIRKTGPRKDPGRSSGARRKPAGHARWSSRQEERPIRFAIGKVDGAARDTKQRNWRFGIVVSYPMRPAHGLRAAFLKRVADGAGQEFDVLSLAYSYSWGGKKE